MTVALDERVCAHPACDRKLVRRRRQSTVLWLRQKYCSPVCASSDRGSRPRSPRRLDLGERVCAARGCSNRLERRAGENSDDWRSRRYCSSQCYRRRSGGGQSLQLPQRECAAPGCGLALKRREGECASDWRRRKFCNVDCRNAGYKRPALAAAPVLVEENTDWESLARCQGRPEKFWAESTDPGETERVESLALRFCAACPASQDCLRRGQQVQFGLFAGVLWRRSARGRLEQIDLLAPVERKASA